MIHGKLRYEPFEGRDLAEVAREALALAIVTRTAIFLHFNGIEIEVVAADEVKGIVRKFACLHPAWQPPQKPRSASIRRVE